MTPIASLPPVLTRPAPPAEASGPPASALPQHPAETARATIMVVDDEPINCKVVRKYLAAAGYQKFLTVTEPVEAMERIPHDKPDLVLLDVMMPGLSGLEILEALRGAEATAYTPVIILTASDDRETRRRALELGATDFLAKPVDASELVPRVHNALAAKAHHDHLAHHAERLEKEVRERTIELTRSRLDLVHCLARAAEYRDNETGRHVVRVGRYAGIIARQVGLDPTTVDLIEQASPLHDVGKLAIPDAVLLKPGKLSPEEYELMQRHCGIGRGILERLSEGDCRTWKDHTQLGALIIGDVDTPFMKMAATIALTHHEKWDGTGYPLGLAGEDIPMAGRITAVADVFDALSTKRPYKPPLPRERCFELMAQDRGKHFDPCVLDAFFTRSAEIIETQIRYADA